MKNLVAVVLLVVFTTLAQAQGTVTPNSEWYIGYQGVHSDVQNFRFSDVAHGINGSATWYVSDSSEQLPIGMTAEVGANFKNSESLITTMAGLKYKAWLPAEKWHPFVHVLAGAARSSTGAGDIGFAFAAGGGLDVNVGSTISIRLIQADYLQTRLFDNTQHGIRFSTGIVF